MYNIGFSPVSYLLKLILLLYLVQSQRKSVVTTAEIRNVDKALCAVMYLNQQWSTECYINIPEPAVLHQPCFFDTLLSVLQSPKMLVILYS